MIELQIINKILKKKSLSLYNDNALTREHFTAYRDEIDWILSHYKKYNQVPDVESFIAEFNDFDLLDVAESDKYLVETIQEQYMYQKLVPFVNKVAEYTKTDSKKAIDFIRSQMDHLMSLSAQYKEGYNIVKNSSDRKADAQFRQEAKGLLGISTGIKELDEITHGWLKEDFIVIVGRTNEGKTWVMLFFLVAAWMAGVPVFLYSGEMSETLVGFRFDTLHGHFSNSAIMGGKEEMGTSSEPKSPEDYYDYLDNLSHNETPFIVCTPKHLGGRRMNISDLHGFIEKYQPGIIGIDQISLMEDERADRGEQNRIRYTHIAEDLYLTSEKYAVPILAPGQASRAAEEKKDGDKAPELTDIAESDGIGQNATRVVSIKKIDTTMKISLKKNRYGKNNQDLLLIWDIDYGIVKPFLTAETDKHGEVQEDNDIQFQAEGEDLF